MLCQSKMAANMVRCRIVTYRYILLLKAQRPNAAFSFMRLLDYAERFLWTNDQLVAETSTRQHKTQQTDTNAHGGVRTLNLGKRAAADLRLRPRGNRDRHRSAL